MPYVQLEERLQKGAAPLFWPVDWEGLSDESTRLIRESFETLIHYYSPLTRETVAQKFRALADLWREETAHLSSITQIAMHPAYQQIIGMGQGVIPFILQELAKEPNQWFWALRALTGIDPVPPLERGRIRNMAAAWLHWGREEGHI
jgi:hypothetical protein